MLKTQTTYLSKSTPNVPQFPEKSVSVPMENVVGVTGNTEDKLHSMILVFALESHGQTHPSSAPGATTVLWGPAPPPFLVLQLTAPVPPTQLQRALCKRLRERLIEAPGFTYTHMGVSARVHTCMWASVCLQPTPRRVQHVSAV